MGLIQALVGCGELQFAEFEREILRERTRADLAHARENGKWLGRPATAAVNAAEIRKVHRAEAIADASPDDKVKRTHTIYPLAKRTITIEHLAGMIERGFKGAADKAEMKELRQGLHDLDAKVTALDEGGHQIRFLNRSARDEGRIPERSARSGVGPNFETTS
jgi:hypothetical protein